MAKTFAKPFYNSKAWKACRLSYIAKRTAIDGGMCEKCKTNLGYIVHHKIQLTPQNITNPDISLNHCNLKYHCKDCHDREEGHFLGDSSQLSCVFDERGQPKPPHIEN